MSLDVSCTPTLPYRHAVGRLGSEFLLRLRDGVILGGRCSRCGLVQVPPHVVCSICYQPVTETVPVGPRGTLTAYTVVTFPFLDPFTGVMRPLPYSYGMVRFYGADNTFQYFLAETDPHKLRLGLQVEAVFAAERHGRLSDLLPFRTV
jgi:hypothetical protein